MNDQTAPFPLTEENLQALLRAISDSTISTSPPTSSANASPSHSLPHTPLNHLVYGTPAHALSPLAQRSQTYRNIDTDDDEFDTDIDTASLTTITDIAAPAGVRQILRTTSTVVSSPQGSVINFAARRAAARIPNAGQRPVQGTRHRRRLENGKLYDE